MENNNHAFYQSDGGIPWTFTPNTNLPNPWNMQQIGPNLGTINHINSGSFPVAEDRTINSIHQPLPQLPTVNSEPRFNSNFHDLSQSSMMMNHQQFYQIGCSQVPPPPMLMNPQPNSQSFNNDYLLNNSLVSFSTPGYQLKQPSTHIPFVTTPPSPLHTQRIFVNDFGQASQSTSLSNINDTSTFIGNRHSDMPFQSNQIFLPPTVNVSQGCQVENDQCDGVWASKFVPYSNFGSISKNRGFSDKRCRNRPSKRRVPEVEICACSPSPAEKPLPSQAEESRSSQAEKSRSSQAEKLPSSPDEKPPYSSGDIPIPGVLSPTGTITISSSSGLSDISSDIDIPENLDIGNVDDVEIYDMDISCSPCSNEEILAIESSGDASLSPPDEEKCFPEQSSSQEDIQNDLKEAQSRADELVSKVSKQIRQRNETSVTNQSDNGLVIKIKRRPKRVENRVKKTDGKDEVLDIGKEKVKRTWKSFKEESKKEQFIIDINEESSEEGSGTSTGDDGVRENGNFNINEFLSQVRAEAVANKTQRVQDQASDRMSDVTGEAQSIIREHEESAKKALSLKRKELRWKLMEASQIQNRAKLEEIRTEANYNKKKMVKFTALVSKLRAKYIKVAKAAKIAESLYKKVEMELLTQEKFVADEKMQLTKLAVDCRNIGAQLYGPDYKLTTNFNIADKDKVKQHMTLKLEAAKSAMREQLLKLEKKASINSPAKRLLDLEKAQASTQVIDSDKTKLNGTVQSTKHNGPLQSAKLNGLIQSAKLNGSIQSTSLNKLNQESKKLKQLPAHLSSLYDLRNSILRNLASYRLTTRFFETGIPITDLNYTHNICPNDYICLPDLIGTCTDKNCLYQHKSNYFMTDIDKLTDILSYKPSLTGFKQDPNLNQEENDNKCRNKLKEYAAKLLAKNSDKPVETIAQNLVKYVRANKSDHELLTMTRELPKVSHLVCNTSDEASVTEPTEK